MTERAELSNPVLPLSYASPPHASLVRLILWIIVCCGIGTGICFWIWELREQRILRSDLTLIIGWSSIGLGLIVVALLLRSTPFSAIRLRTTASIAIVFGLSAFFQIVAIFYLLPVLSDDVARYYTEGRIWLAGHSPYAMSPAQFQDPDVDRNWNARFDPVEQVVAHSSYQSIYPPIAQLTFAAAAKAQQISP